MELRRAEYSEIDRAMEIINMAKEHLRLQGIDQWQKGYPDRECIIRDIEQGKGYFAADAGRVIGYLCIDYDGEPAYDTLSGEWTCEDNYVVVHRMAFDDHARGQGISSGVFRLVEEMSKNRGISYFRVDTDADNHKMQHILKKNGFTYRGTIWFDNSEKIAFDKLM